MTRGEKEREAWFRQIERADAYNTISILGGYGIIDPQELGRNEAEAGLGVSR